MSGERIFLLVLGILVAMTRGFGLIAPRTFAGLVLKLWDSPSFRIWTKPWGLLVAAAGILGLYLAWGLASVQAIVVGALSVLCLVGGVLLLTGTLLALGEKVKQMLSDAFACRVLCGMAVVIGLLLICLAIA